MNTYTKVRLTRGTMSHHTSGPVKSSPVESLTAYYSITEHCGRELWHSQVHCRKGLRERATDGTKGHENASPLVIFHRLDDLSSVFTLSGPGKTGTPRGEDLSQRHRGRERKRTLEQTATCWPLDQEGRHLSQDRIEMGTSPPTLVHR